MTVRQLDYRCWVLASPARGVLPHYPDAATAGDVLAEIRLAEPGASIRQADAPCWTAPDGIAHYGSPDAAAGQPDRAPLGGRAGDLLAAWAAEYDPQPLPVPPPGGYRIRPGDQPPPVPAVDIDGRHENCDAAIAQLTRRAETAEAAADAVRDQARRYLTAVCGPEWLYRAPETFGVAERWIWAVANAQAPLAAVAIAAIERRAAQQHGGGTDRG
jgi:hypothetical protein